MKWQYHFLMVGVDRDDHSIEDALNKLGKDAWELVAVYQASFRVFALKRPLASPPA